MATHGTAKVQRLSASPSKTRFDVAQQGPQEYEEEEDNEADRGSILCHERLAIVGVGECGEGGTHTGAASKGSSFPAQTRAHSRSSPRTER